ncbi:hypothetical protein V6R21_20420 [Limibacter armeniacum]|uniref:hypothetical protein n=1 Tax=Limibacter armeniacum TaxID=466084 RepID=UPI002FE647BE
MISERIKELIDYEGISIRAFEKIIGCGNSVISKAIKNGTDIQAKWIISIVENYPQLNPSWLLLGEGSMLKNQDIKEKPIHIESLSILLTNENLSIVVFAQKIGKDAQQIKDAINAGDKYLPSDFLKPILEAFPNYSPEWLTTNKGEMVRSGLSIEPKKVGDYCEDCLDKEKRITEMEFDMMDLKDTIKEQETEIMQLQARVKHLEEDKNRLEKSLEDKDMIIGLLKGKN